jgi:hypothetical protein
MDTPPGGRVCPQAGGLTGRVKPSADDLASGHRARIAIVGGGIGVLAAAAFLYRAGLPAVVWALALA